MTLLLAFLLLVAVVLAAFWYAASQTPSESRSPLRGMFDVLTCTTCVHGELPRGPKHSPSWKGRRRRKR